MSVLQESQVFFRDLFPFTVHLDVDSENRERI